MTREETKKLIRVIISTYPNWKPTEISDTIDAWFWALEEYPFEAIQMAYKVYLKNDRSGFAPSVNQLITNLQKPVETNQLSEAEAWALVKVAIRNGNYGAEEEFEKLPPLVQKTVGGASMIREWAGTDSDEINTVVASNFQRSYRIIAKREQEKLFLGSEMNALGRLTSELSEKLSGGNQLWLEDSTKK